MNRIIIRINLNQKFCFFNEYSFFNVFEIKQKELAIEDAEERKFMENHKNQHPINYKKVVNHHKKHTVHHKHKHEDDHENRNEQKHNMHKNKSESEVLFFMNNL